MDTLSSKATVQFCLPSDKESTKRNGFAFLGSELFPFRADRPFIARRDLMCWKAKKGCKQVQGIIAQGSQREVTKVVSSASGKIEKYMSIVCFENTPIKIY